MGCDGFPQAQGVGVVSQSHDSHQGHLDSHYQKKSRLNWKRLLLLLLLLLLLMLQLPLQLLVVVCFYLRLGHSTVFFVVAVAVVFVVVFVVSSSLAQPCGFSWQGLIQTNIVDTWIKTLGYAIVCYSWYWCCMIVVFVVVVVVVRSNSSLLLLLVLPLGGGGGGDDGE